jgi:hypothetical protein
VFHLTSNLWTKAGLTNGAVGRIHAIIYSENQQPPSLPADIIATFDDYKGPPFLPNLVKSVPIVPVKRDWHANKIHCTRKMLPIILGYALSIHKLQGSTCEWVILNPGKKEFKKADYLALLNTALDPHYILYWYMLKTDYHNSQKSSGHHALDFSQIQPDMCLYHKNYFVYFSYVCFL